MMPATVLLSGGCFLDQNGALGSRCLPGVEPCRRNARGICHAGGFSCKTGQIISVVGMSALFRFGLGMFSSCPRLHWSREFGRWSTSECCRLLDRRYRWRPLPNRRCTTSLSDLPGVSGTWLRFVVVWGGLQWEPLQPEATPSSQLIEAHSHVPLSRPIMAAPRKVTSQIQRYKQRSAPRLEAERQRSQQVSPASPFPLWGHRGACKTPMVSRCCPCYKWHGGFRPMPSSLSVWQRWQTILPHCRSLQTLPGRRDISCSLRCWSLPRSGLYGAADGGQCSLQPTCHGSSFCHGHKIPSTPAFSKSFPGGPHGPSWRKKTCSGHIRDKLATRIHSLAKSPDHTTCKVLHRRGCTVMAMH